MGEITDQQAERATRAGLPQIILDISRLVSRLLHPTPTGVDRVEMAYARGLLQAAPDRLEFGAVLPHGRYCRLPRSAALKFLDTTEARWEANGEISKSQTALFALKTLLSLSFGTVRPIGRDQRRVLVKASPNSLDRPRLIEGMLRRERADLICMVHDLIPIEFPEYARPDGAARHAARIRTIATFARGVVANSRATLQSLQPWLADVPQQPLTAVAHLGTHFAGRSTSGTTADGRPYFVSIATIEPRKNHLLLLNIWRRMAEEIGTAVPKLILIGRRGWENEQILDMIERCPALQECVEERGRVTDRELPALLSGARALLMPSFAEGYGMPVTEALVHRIPVVCSDLPALREAGQGVPLYLDPLDGPAWRRAIEDLASDASQIAATQQPIMRDWHIPTWEEHIAIVVEMLHKVAQ